MITMKKLEQQILNLENKLNCEKTKREKLDELNILLEKIRHHVEKNPENIYTLHFDDITEHTSIVNVDSNKNIKINKPEYLLARFGK